MRKLDEKLVLDDNLEKWRDAKAKDLKFWVGEFEVEINKLEIRIIDIRIVTSS